MSEKVHMRVLAGVVRGFLVLFLLGGAGAVGYVLHWGLASPGTSSPDEATAHTEHTGGAGHNQAKFWTCSMHPQIRQPKPGKCPICRMDLVPVKSSGGGLRQITIAPETRKLMDIRTTPVQHRYVTARVRMVGKVAYDETRLGYLTAWVSGRLDRLYVDYTGVPVKKGDHMVSMYSPDLYVTSDELILALKSAREGGRYSRLETRRVEAAREKLRLWGMTPKQIKEVESKSKPSDHMTIYAPRGGIVIEKHRQQGDYVKTGDRIYTVADLSQVWVMLDAYESDLPWIRYGQDVVFTTETQPGEEFEGKIAFIDPVLNDRTRTVKVRVNVDNEEGKLKPDMLVRGVVYSRIATGGRVMDAGLAGKWISPMHPEVVKDSPGKCDKCGMPLVKAETLGYVPLEPGAKSRPLVIPVSAALVTGTRAIVYVQIPGKKEPTYEGREIVLGPRAGDYYLVRSGLKKGDLVVTHGNFKIDSALQIQAKPSMMTPEGGGGGGHQHTEGSHKANGTGMPGMKMPHAVHQQLQALEPAYDRVTQAIQEESLAQVRAAFVTFGKALDKVNGKLLSDHSAPEGDVLGGPTKWGDGARELEMVWKELAMLLQNDVVEGREVKQRADAKRVYRLLQRHMERVREQLLKGHQQGPSSTSLKVPREFQVQVGKLWQAYLVLQQALAGDNPRAARKAVTRMHTALKEVDAKNLPEAAQRFWTAKHTNIQRALDQMSQARDLKALRVHFSPLSAELILVVKTFDMGDSGPVYELRCSMAFDGKGANWLQKDNKPANPYFGAEMPACADWVRKIAGESEGGEGR